MHENGDKENASPKLGLGIYQANSNVLATSSQTKQQIEETHQFIPHSRSGTITHTMNARKLEGLVVSSKITHKIMALWL